MAAAWLSSRVRERQHECVQASAYAMGFAAEVQYLRRVEQELVKVLQPRLNAVQDAAADGAQPLQSLRKGVHRALCPVDEEADGDGDSPGLRGISLPCPTSPHLKRFGDLQRGGCLRP